MLIKLTEQLQQRNALSSEQVAAAVEMLTEESVGTEEKAAFLTALAAKGESISEIGAFATELRKKSVSLPLTEQERLETVLDIVGTGGDRLGTFNISTTAAIVIAAAGVKVAKHGNRAVTSKSGSADVLEALGICIDSSPSEAAALLACEGFVFLFAPRFHPAFKNIAPARRLCAERGQRTIFNILGPLLNPVRPSHQLMGVPSPSLCEPLANVLQLLGVQRGFVVCGQAGEACMDELSILGPNTIAEFSHKHPVTLRQISLNSNLPSNVSIGDLIGGDRDENARVTRGILDGTITGAKREAVLWNAGAALYLVEKAPSLEAGRALAAQIIDNGAAQTKLQALIEASKTILATRNRAPAF